MDSPHTTFYFTLNIVLSIPEAGHRGRLKHVGVVNKECIMLFNICVRLEVLTVVFPMKHPCVCRTILYVKG